MRAYFLNPIHLGLHISSYLFSEFAKQPHFSGMPNLLPTCSAPSLVNLTWCPLALGHSYYSYISSSLLLYLFIHLQSTYVVSINVVVIVIRAGDNKKEKTRKTDEAGKVPQLGLLSVQ